MSSSRDDLSSFVELNNVVFPSTDDKYRVQVTTTTGDLPLTIWLESKSTKSQWQCHVSAVNDQLSNSVLPSRMVVAALLRGLVALENQVREKSCGVDVNITTNRLQLSLVIQLLDQFPALYKFDLIPVVLDDAGVLAAKLRDIQEEMANLQRLSIPRGWEVVIGFLMLPLSVFVYSCGCKLSLAISTQARQAANVLAQRFAFESYVLCSVVIAALLFWIGERSKYPKGNSYCVVANGATIEDLVVWHRREPMDPAWVASTTQYIHIVKPGKYTAVLRGKSNEPYHITTQLIVDSAVIATANGCDDAVELFHGFRVETTATLSVAIQGGSIKELTLELSRP
ncbi:hypothetical protein AC1031_007930 [Aphanomyces cochlioides]|nr:hypothetical protein AC1031_007930 [Aphanomyces cochlioides]